jgi:hypothetical protein
MDSAHIHGKHMAGKVLNHCFLLMILMSKQEWQCFRQKAECKRANQDPGIRIFLE